VNTGKGITEIELQPGQFIFGRETAAKSLRMKPTTVRDRMLKLVALGNIVMKSVTHCSVVTVCNWSAYQDVQSDDRQATRQRTATQPPAIRQRTASEEEQIEGVEGIEVVDAPASATHASQQTFIDGTGSQAPQAAKPKSKRKAPAPPVPIPESLDTPEFRAAWADWLAHCRGSAKPKSEQHQRVLLAKMTTWGPDGAIASIREGIESGYPKLLSPSELASRATIKMGANGHAPGRVPAPRGKYDDMGANAGSGLAVRP
jgi:hypothetical protein